MRSRTYAYNGIILGILFGMAAGAYMESVPIGVIVAILGSVICFLIIRFLENLLGRGIDKATDAVANQFAKRGQKSTLQSGNLADRFQSSTPSQPITTQTSAFCTKCGAVTDIPGEFVGPRVSKQVAKENGLLVESCEVVFRGTCSDCMKRQESLS